MRIAYSTLLLVASLSLVPTAQAQTPVSGTISENTTWTLAGSPYLAGNIAVASGATLTVEAGAVVKFTGAGGDILVSGTLDVAGTAAAPVVFTSLRDDTAGGDTNGDGDETAPAPGNWRGVSFAPGSGGALEHVAFRYGGFGFGSDNQVTEYNVLSVSDAAPVFRDCEVAFSQNYGVRVFGTAAPTFERCDLHDNGAIGLYALGATAAPVFTDGSVHDNGQDGVRLETDLAVVTGNTISGNGSYPILAASGSGFSTVVGNSGSGNGSNFGFSLGRDCIGLSSVGADAVWNADAGFPFCVDGIAVASGATLTVEAGAVVKFTGAGGDILVSGTLDVAGTAAAPVVFTSLRDDTAGGDTNGDGDETAPAPGNWRGVSFAPGSGGALEHVAFRYGGFGFGSDNQVTEYNVLSVSDAAPVFRDCEVAFSQNYGVRVFGTAAPSFTRCNIMENATLGLWNLGGELVDADDNYWGAASGPSHPVTNPEGQGNGVSDNVDYRPFRTSTVPINTAPVVAITSGPSGTITTSTATFTWEGNDPNGSIVGYEWALNQQSGSTTSTSRTFSGLGASLYTFRVRAQDDDGGYSYWASRSFTITAQTSVPQIFLSTALLTPGQSVQISGSGYTASEGATLVVAGPSEFEPLFENLMTSGSGTFTYSFSTTPETPPGQYAVFARDEATSRSSPVLGFRIEDAPVPAFALRILSPTSTANCTYNGSAVRLTWQDRMLDRPGYPSSPNSSVDRLYAYDFERSADGGATWTSLPPVTGAYEYGRVLTLTRSLDAPTASSVRFRVTDQYDPSRSVTSAECTPPDVTGEEIEASVAWDYSYPVEPCLPFLPDPELNGVAADGVARLFLRVKDRDMTNGRAIQSVGVSLSDDEGSTGTRLLGCVQHADTYAEIDGDAGVSTAANACGGTPVLTSDPTPGTDGEYWFWYVAPIDFVRTPELDAESGSRIVTATIAATLSDGTTSQLEQSIEVVRPPLMLVHGLGGDPDTWQRFRRSDGTRHIQLRDEDERFKVAVAPRLGPQDSFETNAWSLLGDPAGPNDPAFASVIDQLRCQGYAANQVDYVGHSMGGSMLRAAADPAALWRLNRNYGKGYVHKAITLDTPHNGTELTDLLDDVAEFLGPISVLGQLSTLALDFFVRDGLGVRITDAVRDLQVGADGYHFIATPDVPTHFIAGDIIPGDGSPSEADSDEWRLLSGTTNLKYKLLFDLIIIPAAVDYALVTDLALYAQIQALRFNLYPAERIVRFLNLVGEHHGAVDFGTNGDMAVSRSSQLAGEPETAPHVTVYGRMAHSKAISARVGVTELPQVGDQVSFLLDSPVGSTLFRNGMPASPPAAVRPAPLAAAPRKAFRSAPDRISITAPSPGSTLVAGEALTISVSIPDTTGLSSLKLAFGNDILSVTSVGANVITFAMQAAGVVDSVAVVALAQFDYPDSTVVASDIVSVFVEPEAPPISLSAGGTVQRARVGDEIRLEYEVVFPTFISSIGPGSPILTANVSDPSVVAFDPDTKVFTAVGEGSSLAVVSYRGLSDTLRFAVGAPPAPPAGPVTADVAVALGGAYTGDAMTSHLAADGVLPEAQPFADAVYDGTVLDHDGGEAVAFGFFAANTDVVDWMLIELRVDAAGDAVAQRAALLKADGHIVDLDGSEPVAFGDVAPGAYYVVVRHRNHLPLMSAAPLNFTSGSASYDFTTSLSQAYAGDVGAPAMREGASGVWMLWTGDANADGQVTAPDFNAWSAATGAGETGYLQADFNLDGQVTAPDFNLWSQATAAGATTAVPNAEGVLVRPIGPGSESGHSPEDVVPRVRANPSLGPSKATPGVRPTSPPTKGAGAALESARSQGGQSRVDDR